MSHGRCGTCDAPLDDHLLLTDAFGGHLFVCPTERFAPSTQADGAEA